MKKIIAYLIIIVLLIGLIYGTMKYFNKNKNDIDNFKTTTTTSTIAMTTSTTTTTTSVTTTTTKKSTTTKVTTTKITEKPIESSTGDLVGTSSKGYKIEYKNGAYYVDGYLIANKTYALTKKFTPTNAYSNNFSDDKACSTCIDKTAYKAWNEMKADAAAVGYNMWIQSGFRSYGLQEWLYNKYVNRDGKTAADKYSARPGHSEHQTGLAFDICVKDSTGNYPCISSKFNDTAPAKWLSDNAYRYGYILRYPQDKSNETGYMYESWHFRYVGKELAEALYNDGNWLTMEDYFGIDSKYRD